MKKLSICLTTLCFITLTFADDCNNPLLATFGFEKINTPQSISGLNYCKSLQNGKSCCSASTINLFQVRAQAFADKLVPYAAARDKNMINIRDNVVPSLKQASQQLKSTYSLLSTQLNQIASGQNLDLKDKVQSLNSIMAQTSSIIDSVYDNLETLKSDFKKYQKARATCIVDIVKLQASAWCLACDPTYASKGVSGDTVTMSDGVCQRLQSSCYSYVSASLSQSALISFKSVSGGLGNLMTALTTLAGGDSYDLTKIFGTTSGSGTNEEVLSNLPAEKPNQCTGEGQCPWICTTLFEKGQVNHGLLSIGGHPAGLSQTKRVLTEGDESVIQTKLREKRRNLQSGNWNPDQDEAGVSVTFSDDPSSVQDTPSSSGLMKVGVICLVSMIIAILF